MRKGITLVELLIVIVITVVFFGIIYRVYTRIIKTSTQQSYVLKTQLETLPGLELLRLDLEHAGYGISKNETSNIIEWDKASRKLIIRSILNNTNSKTQSWALVDCSSGSPKILSSGGNIEKNQTVVYLDLDKSFVANSTLSTCPKNSLLLAFPYDRNISSGCLKQFCNKITYKLTNTTNSICNPNTKNLTRAVGNGNGFPLISCVADFLVTFDYDSNGNGKIESNEKNLDVSSFSCNFEDCSKLKQINVYLLVQEGKKDPNYKFSGNTTIDGISLQLPPDYQHYRWKVIKLSVTPMEFVK